MLCNNFINIWCIVIRTLDEILDKKTHLLLIKTGSVAKRACELAISGRIPFIHGAESADYLPMKGNTIY